jgi:hypothetical protein
MYLKKVFEEAGVRQSGPKMVRQYFVDGAEQYLIIAQVEKATGRAISKMKVPFISAPEHIKNLVSQR